ncbi:patatin-like phospholipase family protein [Burkholderia guangdongensis]|uniref:patatin-like phospholipase family protein n=1 Tax=Burkholderia guangdongensis TaxID=1792500 RepID=UPI0015C73023|nr:patatin-like phospholipase family protein [Burkholderia guangdongensis]
MSARAAPAPFLSARSWGEQSTLALAGGGNRCWWQAGAISRLIEEGWAPKQWIGTSAGAAIAAACLTTGPETALEACKALYGQTDRVFRWKRLLRGRVEFAHQTVYPAWLDTFVNDATFGALRASGSSLLVAVTRPAHFLGLGLSVALGTLAYLADKKVWHNIHPRLPAYLGLRQEFIDISCCSDVVDAHRVLLAAAAPPPIMAAVKLHGRYAFDGGYTDNAPIPEQTLIQRQSTLVMLTRHYPSRPQLFQFRDRTYWQPSRPIPVSTWDCTARATVDAAYRLGREDASHLLSRLSV